MKIAPAILPKNLRILKDLGEHIQLARLRRKLSADQIAERTGLGRKTIYNIEQGSPTVAIGSYLQVLFVLGLEKDLTMVAVADPLGRKLQDAGIITRKRAPNNPKYHEISNWRAVAKKFGISNSEIEQTKRAFRLVVNE